MLATLRYFGGVFIRQQMRREVANFRRQTQHCRETQQAVLEDLLRLNADSDFSRTHKLTEVRNSSDLRSHVPVADFEYYRPYVDRLKQGEVSALLGSKQKLLMFTLTSGTTADSKSIPITQRFLEDYRRGWKIWGIQAYDAHPPLFVSDIVQLVGDHQQYNTPGGHPCGNITGLVSAIQNPLVKTMYTVPDLVAKIKDPDARYYTALRCAVANPRVGMVMTANPSTLVHLAKLGDAHKAELIRDIADGTLNPKYQVPAALRGLSSIRRKNPQRARELERMVSHSGGLYPRDYWPGLALQAVWMGGSAACYLADLKEYYGDVPIRDHGLSASEGRMTIPCADGTTDGILDVGTHYFEFIPEAEAESQQPVVLEAHELEPGRDYFILLTTSSGLYRYNIRDVVRCTGFFGTTPTLEFLNKGAHISSLTGEKLSESQVVSAVRSVAHPLGIRLSFFTVAPHWGDPPGYKLLVEGRDLGSQSMGPWLAQNVDTALQEMNCEYGDKRRSGRLSPLAPVLLADGTWQRFARCRQSRPGASLEQYKHPCLSPDLKFCDNLVQQFGTTSAAKAAS